MLMKRAIIGVGACVVPYPKNYGMILVRQFRLVCVQESCRWPRVELDDSRGCRDRVFSGRSPPLLVCCAFFLIHAVNHSSKTKKHKTTG